MTGFSGSLLQPHVLVDKMGRTYRRPAPLDRLNSKLVATANGCQEFSGFRNRNGYGQIGIYGDLYLTHRVMWMAHHGEIPDGLYVCHRCDNPPCCNIEHLFLGTAKQNSSDMVQKARVSCLLNEDNPRTRLSKEDVAEIRLARAAGVTCDLLAAQFGVSPGHVSRVGRGTRRQRA